MYVGKRYYWHEPKFVFSLNPVIDVNLTTKGTWGWWERGGWEGEGWTVGRWGFEFSIHIFILSIATFTDSVFECSPRCPGLVQLYSARPGQPGSSSRPGVSGSSSGTGLAQVYRAYPLQW